MNLKALYEEVAQLVPTGQHLVIQLEIQRYASAPDDPEIRLNIYDGFTWFNGRLAGEALAELRAKYFLQAHPAAEGPFSAIADVQVPE